MAVFEAKLGVWVFVALLFGQHLFFYLNERFGYVSFNNTSLSKDNLFAFLASFSYDDLLNALVSTCRN